MSVSHSGSSGQALRTLSQCCGHSSVISSLHHSQRYATTTPTPNPTCLAGLSQPGVKASAISGAVRRGTEHSL